MELFKDNLNIPERLNNVFDQEESYEVISEEYEDVISRERKLEIMIEITSLNEDLKDHLKRINDLRGIFDVDKKSSRLELISKLSEPSAWDDPQKAQGLNKEKVNLEKELR